MSEHTLMLIEATGIQEYIFGSNQLAQNIGASELVTRATTDWVIAELNQLGLKHNAIKNVKGEWEPNDQSIYSMAFRPKSFTWAAETPCSCSPMMDRLGNLPAA